MNYFAIKIQKHATCTQYSICIIILKRETLKNDRINAALLKPTPTNQQLMRFFILEKTR